MGKKQENKKRVVNYKGGRCLYSCVLLRFGNTLGCPSLRRMHSYRNLPYKLTSSWCKQRKVRRKEKGPELYLTFPPKVTTARIDFHQILRLHIPWQKVSPMSSQMINL
jgi:hypothetical protein